MGSISTTGFELELVKCAKVRLDISWACKTSRIHSLVLASMIECE